jgi:hypothetical protein
LGVPETDPDGGAAKEFEQLELQHEGPAALVGRPEIVKELQITNEERRQVVAIIQELQSTIEPLIKEAKSRGNPQEILPKVIKIREDYDGKIEAILSDAQKKQWKEMRGKPFDVFNDNCAGLGMGQVLIRHAILNSSVITERFMNLYCLKHIFIL